MSLWKRLLPAGLAGQFALLLLLALVGVNAIAALLLAREGSGFDRAVRIQGDMGRLVALVTALEEVPHDTGLSILAHSTTGFTRFSLGPRPLGPEDAPSADGIEAQIARGLPGRAIRVVDGSRGQSEAGAPLLLMVSVQLTAGAHRGEWLNSLLYPLPPATAWPRKSSFFAPLVLSLAGTLVVGLIFIRRMTQPLRDLARAARAAGDGERNARVPVAGARELRDAAIAFNDMQARIADFENERMRFLAAVGHDLRTPITSLRIRAELLDDAEIRDPMICTLDEMGVMTDDLMRYARGMTAGEDRVPTDLRALLSRLCHDRGATLAEAAPLTLRLRPVAISRAVGNLIDNAVRYAGGATVRMERQATEAVITVEDRGPGVPPEKLERIAEPFVRGEPSRSAQSGGIGLGLSIARDIAVSHGGALKLSNRQGGGFQAELRLPLEQAQGAG
ncbi:MAG: ATP-binding protein [Paracoccaceae bacterium]